MTEQQRNLGCPFAQRGNIDGQHIQPVIQIFPEAPRLHRFLNLHIGRRQHPYIRVDQVPPAESRILVVLKDVQQLGLQVRAHLRDLVEKDGALVGQFEFPGFGPYRTGKSSLLKTKQLGFQQLSGQRRAVHLHEWLVAPRRAQVNHPCHHFFPYAAFPADKHWHIYGRNLQDLLADSNHLRARRQKAQIFGDLVAAIAQLNMITFRLRSSCINSFSVSSPFISGIKTSKIMKSGRSPALIFPSASLPELTVSTAKPSTSSSVCKYFLMLGSSSTTRIVSFTVIELSFAQDRPSFKLLPPISSDPWAVET